MEECKNKNKDEKPSKDKSKDKSLGRPTAPAHNTIEAKDALRVIHSHIDSMQKQLDCEFEKVPVISLDQEDEYFICKNKFWDLWFQKLFAQIISIKMWVLALITVLLVMDFITATIFGTLFGIIMGLRGAFQVAEVWRNPGDLNPMDKT